MATSFTTNLKLRLTDDLTADARANLEKIDTLGATFKVDSTEELLIRSKADILIEPNAADLDGSGTGGTVRVGTASHSIEALNVWADDVALTGNLDITGNTAFDNMRVQSDSDETVGFVAPSGLGASFDWTLPSGDGSNAQVLQTDGSGNLSFATVLTDNLPEFNVRVGDSSGVAQQTDTSTLGDIQASTTGGLVIKAGAIVDADVSTSAAITRTKLADGTADSVIINDGTGALTSETTLAISRGGTNAATASDARDNLGLTIGTNVQAWDSDLDDLAALAQGSNNIIQSDGANWTSVTPATARVNLGLDIGADVQAWDSDLDDLAALSPSDDEFIVSSGSSWTLQNASTARSSMGLGTIATQDASGVAITGGVIDGTAVGGTTPATGGFTTLSTTGAITAGGDVDVSAAGNWNLGASVGANNLTLGAAASTVVVAGNLQVDGTTTTVNTDTLDVEDANISVNVNGNQAAADDTAGLTVEMSDATNASLLYDKDAATRWRVGDVGSEVEVVDLSTSQTLSNKTITGSRNYSEAWTNAQGTSKTVTHSLGTNNVMVQIYDNNLETILVDTVDRSSTNQLTLTSSVAPSADWTVLVKEVN